MPERLLCEKPLAQLAKSIFDHEGAIPLPSRWIDFLDAHPELRREKGVHAPYVRVRIGAVCLEKARLERTGNARGGAGKYQLRLGKEGAQAIARLCPEDYYAFRNGETAEEGASFALYVSENAPEFMLVLNTVDELQREAEWNRQADEVSPRQARRHLEHAAQTARPRPRPVRTGSVRTNGASALDMAAAKERDGYTCAMQTPEDACRHESFPAMAGGEVRRYMEGHHLIPRGRQSRYEVDIDRLENVVCLCSNCHRRIHYGLPEDKARMLHVLLEKYGARIRDSVLGRELTIEELLELYELRGGDA